MIYATDFADNLRAVATLVAVLAVIILIPWLVHQVSRIRLGVGKSYIQLNNRPKEDLGTVATDLIEVRDFIRRHGDILIDHMRITDARLEKLEAELKQAS